MFNEFQENISPGKNMFDVINLLLVEATMVRNIYVVFEYLSRKPGIEPRFRVVIVGKSKHYTTTTTILSTMNNLEYLKYATVSRNFVNTFRFENIGKSQLLPKVIKHQIILI